MKKTFLVFLAVLLMASSSFALSYSTDFESAIGSEWSGSTSIATGNATFTNFLGRLGNNTTSLSLTGLGAGNHSIVLTFDFYAIDSWDGDGTAWGIDYFGISGDYNNEWTVARSTSSATQTFPYTPSETGSFGYNSRWTDDIYRDISISFVQTGDTLDLSFYGHNLQGINDESWGLDNVRVETAPVPEPATFILLGSGLAGLAFYRRKRK
jgi:hypothetical protein